MIDDRQTDHATEKCVAIGGIGGATAIWSNNNDDDDFNVWRTINRSYQRPGKAYFVWQHVSVSLQRYCCVPISETVLLITTKHQTSTVTSDFVLTFFQPFASLHFGA